MVKSPHLKTKRLWLCPWDNSDLEVARPIFTDPDVMRYINGGQPLADAAICDFLVRQQNHFRSRGFCLWKLLLKPERRFAGFCGLQPLELDGAKEIEIGWRLRKENWGQGLATEAARAALADSVARHGFSRVIAIAMPQNHASLRVMEKLGMEYERATRKGGFDVVVYSRDCALSEPATKSS
ncbi:MAG TPA: GNAT family N-acetyltransferase [Candidatus Acidoferrales bacterium]|nr:GNAT family N-acetyltransferase [Candidatus Acidoferrales bacterium]